MTVIMAYSEQEIIELLRAGFDHSYCEPGSTSEEYFWFRKRQRVLHLIDRHLLCLSRCDGRHWTAMDLGCGEGVDLYLIRKRILEAGFDTQARFLGVDGNPESIRMCTLKKAYYRASDSHFLRCDLSRTPLPFADAQFDFIYCSEVLEHLREPEALIAEIGRITKPGGHLLATTPNEPNPLQRSYWNRRRYRAHLEEELANPIKLISAANGSFQVFGHISVRPIAKWENLLSTAGFRRVDFERGALVYEMPKLLRGELATGLRFCFEAVLDALPKSWVRWISDEMIGLYRRSG